MTVEATNVSSLLEVGVGINFALALLEGFRTRLEEYSRYVAKTSLNKKQIIEGLDILRVAEATNGTNIIKEATIDAATYDERIDALPADVGFANATWDVLKFISISCGLFLFANAIRFSFGGYKLADWEIWGLAITSAFPFMIIVYTVVRSGIKAMRLKIQVKSFLKEHKKLIDNFRELQQKTIPPTN